MSNLIIGDANPSTDSEILTIPGDIDFDIAIDITTNPNLDEYQSSFDHIIVKPQDKSLYLNIQIWINLFDLISDVGILTVENFKTLIGKEYINILLDINNYFILIFEDANKTTFRKIITLRPEITTAKSINEAIAISQSVNQLFNKNADKQICSIVHDKNRIGKGIGSGTEGTVFKVAEWRTDVVIKRIITDKLFIDGVEDFQVFRDPVDGKYKEDSSLIEVLASASMDIIASGNRPNFHNIHFPRYAGYFVCPQIPDKGKNNSTIFPISRHIQETTFTELYIITEYMANSTTLTKYISRNIEQGDAIAQRYKKVKIAMWQAIFAIITMNRAGWMHQDASSKNFLMQNLDLNVDDLVYEINGKKYIIPKTPMIPKLTDFGYANRVINSSILQNSANTIDQNMPEIQLKFTIGNDAFRLENRFRKGFDVSYFLLSLLQSLNPKDNPIPFLVPLYKDWLISLNHSVEHLEVNLIDIINLHRSNRLTEKNFRYNLLNDILILGTFRPKPIVDNWDPIVILESSFFSDILTVE